MIFPYRVLVPTRRPPLVNYGLVVLNFLVFMLGLRLTPDQRERVAITFGFIPARVDQVFHPRPLVVPLEPRPAVVDGVPVIVNREYVLEPVAPLIAATLFTSLFLHGSWLHLLGNMWFLWLFGRNVEDRLGPVSYGCFYVLGGLLATLFHWWRDPSSLLPVIGASGAIAAVLGAFAVTWPLARIRSIVVLIVFVTVFELPALVVLGVWFLTQVVEAQNSQVLGLNGGVAWWAHIGGFVAGAIVMPLVRDAPPPPPPAPPEDDHFEELI